MKKRIKEIKSGIPENYDAMTAGIVKVGEIHTNHNYYFDCQPDTIMYHTMYKTSIYEDPSEAEDELIEIVKDKVKNAQIVFWRTEPIILTVYDYPYCVGFQGFVRLSVLDKKDGP